MVISLALNVGHMTLTYHDFIQIILLNQPFEIVIRGFDVIWSCTAHYECDYGVESN